MAVITPRAGSKKASKKSASAVITNAHAGASREVSLREKRYVITMAIRTACFISMIFVPGPFRWVLLAAAVFLPYIAVLLANQVDTRTGSDQMVHGEPSPAPQLTTGPASPEVIDGELLDDEPPARHVADDQTTRDRVA